MAHCSITKSRNQHLLFLAQKGITQVAIVNLIVSDITGKTVENGSAIEVIIRHPKLGDKKIDAIQGELDALKTIQNVVTLEIRDADGRESELLCTAAELAKIIPDEKLAAAQGTRGRRRGFSPA